MILTKAMRAFRLALLSSAVGMLSYCSSGDNADDPVTPKEGDLEGGSEAAEVAAEQAPETSEAPPAVITEDPYAGSKAPPAAEPPPTQHDYQKAFDDKPAVTQTSPSMGGEKSAYGSGSSRRYVKASMLNIRSRPNNKSQVVRKLSRGDEVMVTIKGAWAKLNDGEWVKSRYLSKSMPDVKKKKNKKRGAKKSKAKSKKPPKEPIAPASTVEPDASPMDQ